MESKLASALSATKKAKQEQHSIYSVLMLQTRKLWREVWAEKIIT
jgi:hypothetical protein